MGTYFWKNQNKISGRKTRKESKTYLARKKDVEFQMR
jgi:hypothetical protein